MEGNVYRRITELCGQMQAETDHARFTQLVEELNRLLDQADKPPTSPETKKSSPADAA